MAAERPTYFLTLRDGRRLAYMELGGPDGFPIVHHHGMPGSRMQHEAEPEAYEQLGVRVVTPDRPGYGLSDPHPGSSLLDWAEDVRELVDSLGVARFGMTALSGGGIYALACAAALGDRITDVVTTGCPAPMQVPHAFRGMRFLTRAGVWFAGHSPWLMYGVGRVVVGLVERYPRFFFKQFNREMPAPDRLWLSTPSVEGSQVDDLREGLRHGAAGYVHDLELLARPWGFDLGSIRVPVDLWHGDADVTIPPDHGFYLAASIPGARLHVCVGEAHLLLWNHLTEILLTASGCGPANVPSDAGRSALLVAQGGGDTRAITRVEVS